MVELGGIPAIGGTLSLRGVEGGRHEEVLRDVVGHNLLATRGADGVGHRVDVGANLLVAIEDAGRLVQNLDGNDVGLLLIQFSRVAVAVVEELGHVVLLGTNRIGVEVERMLGVVSRESGQVAIAIGPPGSVGHRGREEHQNTSFRSAVDEVVEQVEVLVIEEVARLVRVLPVAPEREAQRAESHACEVRHVDVDHALLLLERGGYLVGCAVVRSRGKAVVGTKNGHFASIVRVTNHTFGILEDQLLGRKCRYRHQCDNRKQMFHSY